LTLAPAPGKRNTRRTAYPKKKHIKNQLREQNKGSSVHCLVKKKIKNPPQTPLFPK